MTPIKQLFRHDPPRTWGDCHRTAIACILNMRPQDVPHFFDNCIDNSPAPEQHAHCAMWLERRGIIQIQIMFSGESSLADVLSTMAGLNPGIAFILGGQSKNRVNHSVVVLNGEIFCDPSLDDAGIIGPMDDGNWWLTFFGARVAKP